MRNPWLLPCLIAATALLAACGNKGPLVRPATQQSAPMPATADPTPRDDAVSPTDNSPPIEQPVPVDEPVDDQAEDVPTEDSGDPAVR